MSDILDVNGNPLTPSAEAKEAARQALASEDPGWWSDLNPQALKVVDGHFWKLTHVGRDEIRLTYHGPTSRKRKRG